MTQHRPPGLLSTEDAARSLGVSMSALSTWARNGDIEVAYKLDGGARMFAPSELARFRRSRTEGHGPECPRLADPFSTGSVECQCVACHCRNHDPSGFLGVCIHCGRPLVVDGVTIRGGKPMERHVA